MSGRTANDTGDNQNQCDDMVGVQFIAQKYDAHNTAGDRDKMGVNLTSGSTNQRYAFIPVKWFTEFGHLNRGDMLTSEQYRCHNEKKKFQRRV